MKIRRHAPTVFNLSMVDILCCALGCVILLWLIYSRQANRRTEEAVKVAEELKLTKSLLTDTKQKYDGNLVALSRTQEENANLQSDLSTLRNDYASILASLKKKKDAYDNLTKKLNLASSRIVMLEKTLDDKDRKLLQTTSNEKELNAQLARLNKLYEEMTRRLRDSEKDVKNLTGEMKLSDQQIQSLIAKLAAADRNVKDLTGKLTASEMTLENLNRMVASLKNESTKNTQKLANSKENALATEKMLLAGKTQVASLNKQLDELLKHKQNLEKLLYDSKQDLKYAGITIANLQADKSKLVRQRNMLHAAFSNRFAGINLTGRKVIFLVDVSGSMSMVDGKTLAPDKWPEVCATLGKMMNSLPNLTHFQVIAFSENVWYPLGSTGRWLTYDSKTSAKFMIGEMLKTKPSGGTKMRPAFAEAFQNFGNQGLDTIYLISDGLPNDDDNLPPEVQKLQGVQRTAYLSNSVRQLLKTTWNRPVNGRVPVRINAVGYFFESPEVGAFLWALSRDNDGSFVGMSHP